MGIRYTFGRSAFDPRLGVLTVEGEDCALRPRTAAVLEQLLRRPGTLVTRAELLGAVWPGRVVTPNSLEQCMSELRRGLNGSCGAALRTVPRRGYVLEAEVRSADAPAHAQAGGVRRLAVLPFISRGSGQALVRFAEALAGDLAAGIARGPCVSLVSLATAAACAREAGGDVRTLGRRLRVDYIVEGTAWREDSAWQVALTAAETGEARQVWSESFRGSGRAPSGEVRGTMAAAAANRLAAALTALESRAFCPGSARDAREMTRRGYYLLMQALPQLAPEALALAKEAREVDALAAGPWALISSWHLAAVTTGASTETDADLGAAETAARRAIALDPMHPLAYAALGGALAYSGRFAEAFAALARQEAIDAAHPSAHHWRGRAQVFGGDAVAAVASMTRALELAPRDHRRSVLLEGLALAHLHRGDGRAALEVARESVAEPRPWPRSFETFAMALVAEGRAKEAREAVATLLDRWPMRTGAHAEAELKTRHPAFAARQRRFLRALVRAGLPTA